MTMINPSLPRRTFLRGLGATLALPLLESMTPRMSAIGPSTPPIRLGYVYTPNGIVGACDKSPRPFMWTPRTVGANFEFSPTMKALEPFREQLTIVSEFGVEFAQGFYFSRPVDCLEFGELLRDTERIKARLAR